MRSLQDVVRVKKPTVVRKNGNTVEKCFMYEGMEECFQERCFWKQNGECPIAESLSEK